MCKQDVNNTDEVCTWSSNYPKFIKSLAKFKPQQHLNGKSSSASVGLETILVVFLVGFT